MMTPIYAKCWRIVLSPWGIVYSAAETAKVGLELLERQNPQLVLLDIEMPDMNGIDMLREIRRR